MSKCKEAIYNSEIETTVIQQITEGTRPYINQIYTNSYGFKWYINSKGYYHIIRLEPCKAVGKTWGMIVYYRLKPNGKLAEEGSRMFADYEESEKIFNGEENLINDRV